MTEGKQNMESETKDKKFENPPPHVIIYSEDVNEGEDEASIFTLADQRTISLVIHYIENIDICKIKDIKIKAEFLKNPIIETDIINVKESHVELQSNGFVEAVVTPEFIEDVLNNPILFTVFDCTTTTIPAQVTPKVEKETKKKKSKTPISPQTSSSHPDASQKILGVCNLDIGSLAMETYTLKETVVLEPEKRIPLHNNVSWTKLPRIFVEVFTENEPLISVLGAKSYNVLGITVESVYNPPDHIKEGMLFDVKFQIPNSKNKNNTIVFPNGLATVLKDSSGRKKWFNLINEEGNLSKSKYLIKPTSCDIHSTLPEDVNLEREINGMHMLIEWNIWKNFLLEKKDEKSFFSKLIKTRIWPVEILVSKPPPVKTKGDKERKTAKPGPPPPAPSSLQATESYVAFLNLSSLLYPGVSKIRAAAQLHNVSSWPLQSKTIPESTIELPQTKGSSLKKLGSKTLSNRSKGSVKEPGDVKNESSSLVFNSLGRRSFIIVEVQLYRPLVPKKDPEYLDQKLSNYLSVKGKMTKVETNLQLARENYITVIKDIVTALNKEYQTFGVDFERRKYEGQSMDVEFEIYLNQSEIYQKIKGTLEKKIVELVKEKYGTVDQSTVKMPEIYAYLVEEMHRVTNRGYFQHEKLFASSYNTSNLQLYSEEAMEEGDLELAKMYQLMKLTNDPCNPDYWLDYAVFCNQTNDVETAIEAVREALTLASHHQLGLLMYGLLMSTLNNGSIATLTFEVLLSKYPDFVEGWVILRLLYLIFNNPEGAEVVGQTATKIECEKKLKENVCVINEGSFTLDKVYREDYELAGGPKYGISAFINGKSLSEPLSWSSALSPPNNVYAITTVLLLKLGFYNMACVALSQAMFEDHAKTNPYYMYYRAVTNYVMGKYGEAMSTLKDLVNSYGKECSAWALMGHCYYKLEENEKAIVCYEYIIECFSRPDDIHLIYLRMGYYYIQTQKFDCAKNVFLTACKYSPSPKLWRGAGIACLRLGELGDAETAFKESNYLDNRDPDTWAYLALTNILFQKIDLFKYCYSEAKKRNLTNEALIQEIETCIILNRVTDVE